MRNRMADLNNHLFAEMERLSDEDLTGEALAGEITRAKAINQTANNIIGNGNLMLRAAEFQDQALSSHARLPEALEDGGRDGQA